jgi:hypothetical protein
VFVALVAKSHPYNQEMVVFSTRKRQFFVRHACCRKKICVNEEKNVTLHIEEKYSRKQLS